MIWSENKHPNLKKIYIKHQNKTILIQKRTDKLGFPTFRKYRALFIIIYTTTRRSPSVNETDPRSEMRVGTRGGDVFPFRINPIVGYHPTDLGIITSMPRTPTGLQFSGRAAAQVSPVDRFLLLGYVSHLIRILIFCFKRMSVLWKLAVFICELFAFIESYNEILYRDDDWTYWCSLISAKWYSWLNVYFIIAEFSFVFSIIRSFSVLSLVLVSNCFSWWKRRLRTAGFVCAWIRIQLHFVLVVCVCGEVWAVLVLRSIKGLKWW